MFFFSNIDQNHHLWNIWVSLQLQWWCQWQFKCCWCKYFHCTFVKQRYSFWCWGFIFIVIMLILLWEELILRLVNISLLEMISHIDSYVWLLKTTIKISYNAIRVLIRTTYFILCLSIDADANANVNANFNLVVVIFDL